MIKKYSIIFFIIICFYATVVSVSAETCIPCMGTEQCYRLAVEYAASQGYSPVLVDVQTDISGLQDYVFRYRNRQTGAIVIYPEVPGQGEYSNALHVTEQGCPNSAWTRPDGYRGQLSDCDKRFAEDEFLASTPPEHKRFVTQICYDGCHSKKIAEVYYTGGDCNPKCISATPYGQKSGDVLNTAGNISSIDPGNYYTWVNILIQTCRISPDGQYYDYIEIRNTDSGVMLPGYPQSFVSPCNECDQQRQWSASALSNINLIPDKRRDEKWTIIGSASGGCYYSENTSSPGWHQYIFCVYCNSQGVCSENFGDCKPCISIGNTDMEVHDDVPVPQPVPPLNDIGPDSWTRDDISDLLTGQRQSDIDQMRGFNNLIQLGTSQFNELQQIRQNTWQLHSDVEALGGSINDLNDDLSDGLSDGFGDISEGLDGISDVLKSIRDTEGTLEDPDYSDLMEVNYYLTGEESNEIAGRTGLPLTGQTPWQNFWTNPGYFQSRIIAYFTETSNRISQLILDRLGLRNLTAACENIMIDLSAVSLGSHIISVCEWENIIETVGNILLFFGGILGVFRMFGATNK